MKGVIRYLGRKKARKAWIWFYGVLKAKKKDRDAGSGHNGHEQRWNLRTYYRAGTSTEEYLKY